MKIALAAEKLLQGEASTHWTSSEERYGYNVTFTAVRRRFIVDFIYRNSNGNSDLNSNRRRVPGAKGDR